MSINSEKWQEKSQSCSYRNTELNAKETTLKNVDVSEDGTICAVVSNGHLSIFDVCTNKTVLTLKKKFHSTKPKILKISPSKQVLACLPTSPSYLSLIHINTGKITRFEAGTDYLLEYILWNPNGKTLAAFSSLSIFIDIYEIEEDCVCLASSISGAKCDRFGCPLAQFSYDGDYFSTINVSEAGHAITIYNSSSSSWECVQRVFSSDMVEVDGLRWCRDSASLLVWQSGPSLCLQLWTLDGRLEHQLMAEAAPLACVSLSACGRNAALLSIDARVRILDLLTWQLGVMGVLVHCPIIHKSSARIRLREIDNSTGPVHLCEPVSATVCELNYVSQRTKSRCLLQFSSDAQYLSTYEPTYPNTLWIWNLTSDLPLDTVVLLKDHTLVQGLLWHSERTIMAASLNHSKVLVWTPEQTIIINQCENQCPLTAETYFSIVPNSNCDRLSLIKI